MVMPRNALAFVIICPQISSGNIGKNGDISSRVCHFYKCVYYISAKIIPVSSASIFEILMCAIPICFLEGSVMFPSNCKSMLTAYARFWEFHIGGYIVTNVTNLLFIIVWNVQYIFLF